jgi:type II secretory pathway component PulM
MTIAIAALLAVLVMAYLLFVRPQDLHKAEAVSPFAHLDERKASIYENLRDLQFEYRLGKMSDDDYQRSKQDLQKELARVMAEVEKVAGGLPVQVKAAAPRSKSAFICPSCNAEFPQALKFCGECGKPMNAKKATA